MCKITLIATIHNECGICNSKELYKLIEQISPDVIFEELSPDGFSAIYGGLNFDTLETNTIKSYIQKHPVSHFPVDINKNELFDNHFRSDIMEMFNLFGDDKEYYELLSQRHISSERVGFSYLNSDQYGELCDRKFFLEKIILKNIKQKKWLQIYKRWLKIIELREIEMIRNIYNYCTKFKYDSALFLIGVDHRKSIMDRISKLEMQNEPRLNWNFNYFT